MTDTEATNPGCLEVPAVMSGALVALTIVVPAAIVQLAVANPSARWALFGIILAGFGVGGWRAAGIARATPLTSAAVAALAAFVAAQSLAVAIRLAGGGSVTIPALAFLAMLATSCGMLGAVVKLRVSPAA